MQHTGDLPPQQDIRPGSVPPETFDTREANPPADSRQATADETVELTETQREALHDYTAGGYLDLKRRLLEGAIEDIEGIAATSATLSEALEALPAHEGIVLRGSTTTLSDEVIERYEPGETIVENQYVSATLDPNREFGGNVLWVIESKQGRHVEDLSSIEPEREVMFDRFPRFRVLAKFRLGEDSSPPGRWLIYMEEL